jgi:hypothetical protein
VVTLEWRLADLRRRFASVRSAADVARDTVVVQRLLQAVEGLLLEGLERTRGVRARLLPGIAVEEAGGTMGGVGQSGTVGLEGGS